MGKYSTKHIKELTLNNIKELVSDYSLFKYYISNFQEVNRKFCSELRDDRRPSCVIYVTENNNLRYKDFGTDTNVSVIEYICLKFNCTFIESLKIINNDFNLKLGFSQIKANTTTLGYFGIVDNNIHKYEFKTAEIAFKSRLFTDKDIEYWNQYYINITKETDIKSISHYWINDSFFNCEKELAFVYLESNNSCKLYFPERQEYRFFTNSKKPGFYQVNNDNLWIITSSKKDALVYRNLGYNSLYSQAESILVSKELLEGKNCIVNLDNDSTGKKYTEKYIEKYNFKYFYTPEKDISDTIKVLGIEETKKLILNEIKNRI